MKITDVLKKTRLTEKSYLLAATGKYMFEVDTDASKDDIKDAIEKLYNVSVMSVHTINYRGKLKTRGRARNTVLKGKTKKAIVELKKGQTINTFDEIFNTGK